MSLECIQHGEWDDDYCGPDCVSMTALWHSPGPGADKDCSGCGYLWPCPSIRALRGHDL